MAAAMFRGSRINKYVKLVPLIHARKNQSIATQEINDEDSHYPAVKPKYPPGKWGEMDPRIAWFWEGHRREIAVKRFAKDKLELLTKRPFRTWKYNCIDTTPNLLDYQCGVTKTFIVEDSLPGLYNTMDVEEDFHTLKPIMIETLSQLHQLNRNRLIKLTKLTDSSTPGRHKSNIESNLSRAFLQSILTNLLGSIGGNRKDILESHIDYDAKVSACWSRHGVLRHKLRMKRSSSYIRQNNDMFYGEHIVDVQVRKDKPLPEFVSMGDKLCNTLSYRSMLEYSPKVLGQFMQTLTRKVTAGYTFGDTQEFNHLSILLNKNNALERMNRFGDQYRMDADTGYFMSTGFLSTVAQAHMQGFNEYEELTYPFTSQTILTDGKLFILSAYQLNTLQLWKDDMANSLQNVCWMKKGENLYEDFENGKIVGFNDDLFKSLLKFLLIKPCDRKGINLSPNLEESSVTIPVIADKKIYTMVEQPIEYDRT